MPYIKCPTCNRLISDKIIPYENGIKKINDDPSLTKEQKEKEKMKLMDSLHIPKDNYCCRMRLMSYKDLVTIVK